MGMYIVGQNIDSNAAHYRTQKGDLQQVMRGIYMDSGDTDEVILKHAVRIAKYLYPKTYLTGPSAVLLGPTEDGRLFLASRRRERRRLRALEIIQVEAPQNSSVTAATIRDPLGDVVVDISSTRQRLLEAFQPRSEVSLAMSDDMREALVERLISEHGSGPKAVDAVWAIARETGMYKEAEHAERALLCQRPVHVAASEQGVDLYVAWHKVPLGRLHHNGYEWRWTPDKVDLPSPIRDSAPGKLPPFISALLPEGWLEQVLNQRSERETLLSGRRYMSNISIVTDLASLGAIPEDTLHGSLSDFSSNGEFTGKYAGPGRDSIEEGLERSIANIYKDVDTPRLSGVQVKLPMFLNSSGHLQSATGRPFTHILKPAGTVGFEGLPIVEWACLTLAAFVGFTVPAIALVDMPDDLPPAMVVERFDIRRNLEDKTFYCLEDFCSLAGVSAEAKYHSTIERIARDLTTSSSDGDADLRTLFCRAFFAWIIADGDMHLKNLALLKTAHAGSKLFDRVRFAPAYDVVSTRVFPSLVNDRLALKLNGKDDRLRRSDFIAAARTMGLPAGKADDEMNRIISLTRDAILKFELPLLDGKISEEVKKRVHGLIGIVNERISSVG